MAEVVWTEADTQRAIEFERFYEGLEDKSGSGDFGEFMRRLNRDGPTKES